MSVNYLVVDSNNTLNGDDQFKRFYNLNIDKMTTNYNPISSMKRLISLSALPFSLWFILILNSSGLLTAQVCSGDITLTTQAQVDAFSCTSVTGYLIINGSGITNLNGLSGLTSVGDFLGISNTSITNVAGLSSLTSVQGNIFFSSNTALTNVDGLSALSTAGGMDFFGNTNLTNVNGLSGLATIGGNLTFTVNPKLANLNGLSNLTSIGGGITINGNSLLANINGLSNLTFLGTTLVITNNAALTHLNALSGLTAVPGGFLIVRDNANLTQIDGLINVSSVGGFLHVINNDKLTNLNGLGSLSSLPGGLTITGNAILNSFCGLYYISSLGPITSFTLNTNQTNPTQANIVAAGPCPNCPAPVARCKNITVTLDGNGNSSIQFSDINNGSSTPCGLASGTVSPTTFTCGNVGTNTVTLTVTDVNGNSSSCTATVTVVDNVPPVPICQNVTVQLDDTGTGSTTPASVNYLSSDNCGIASLSLSVMNFSCADVGPNTVTLTVTDVNNNPATCMATVTVEDNTLPVVTCPEFTATFSACADEIDANTPSGTFFPVGDLANFSVAAGGVYVASFDLTTCVTDNCVGEGFQAAFVDSYAENRIPGCSVDIVNVVAIRDAAGNQAADSIFFRFTFAFDGDPPVITCPANTNIECGVTPTAAATDASATSGCGTPIVTVSDAVINGEPNIAGTTYTFTYTATDGCGKMSTCDQVFTVIDNTPPTITCFNQTIIFNGEPSIPLVGADLVDATDNCGETTTTLSPNSISSSQVGQTVPVLVIVSDINNNSSTCTSQITVGGLPSGWSQNANGVGCAGGNDIDYNATTQVWTSTSTNCYYSSPFTMDATAFAQRTLCGNGSITAQVTGIIGSSLGWAGVVMRESNDPGAKKAQLTTNMSNFSRREFRTMTNGSAFPQQFPSQNRRWLRLVRSGNQFAMYVSANGVNWAFAGAQNIQMNSCIEIGLVTTNYNANSTVTATFANVAFTGNGSMQYGLQTDNGNIAANAPYDADFSVYPNPTSGELNVSLLGYAGRAVTMEVYSTMGQLLFTHKVDAAHNMDEIIDLSQFANGMYLIRVDSEGVPAAVKRVTLAR